MNLLPSPAPSALAPHVPLRREETLDFVMHWRSIAKRKWWILGFAALVTTVTGVLVGLQAPIYRSTATLLIEQNRPRIAPTDEVAAAPPESREHFQTQAEVLKSRALAVKIVDRLGLDTHPDFDPRQRPLSRLDALKEAVGLSVERPVWTESAAREVAIGSLMNRIGVEPVRQSQLIRVSFESTDRVAAADIANAVANTYIESDAESRSGLTRRTNAWLASRLEGLKKSLEDSERTLQDYRERARIIETKDLAQAGASTQLADLMGRLVAARQRRYAAEHAYNQVRETSDHGILPAVMRNPMVARLKDAESEAEKRVAELSNRYGPEHDRMLQAQADLKQARASTRAQVDAVVSSLKSEYELARANEQALERSIADAKSNVQRINRKEFDLVGLERAVATNRQIYELFLNRYKETRASPDLKSAAIARITDSATPGHSPVKPKKEQITVIAFLLSLMLGCVFALLRERFDHTIMSAEEVEEKLGHPMLTMLPLLKGPAAQNAGRHYLDDPTSVFSEAIRTARTSVLLSAGDAPKVAVLVTSSVPGEGKTTVAVNFALAEAQVKRVLLVEADLRRPSITNQLNLDPSKPGLTDLLSGSATFSACLQRVEGSSLFVLTSGAVPINPLELILSQRFQNLMKGLAGTCDMLVIDAPPVHLVSDALVLSRLATGVLFVVRADRTPYPLAKSCLRALSDVYAKVFGIALNQLDLKKAERYYGSYYGSYARYGGYGEPRKIGGGAPARLSEAKEAAS
jgi:polysaccharide biosynthesis transport protein